MKIKLISVFALILALVLTLSSCSMGAVKSTDEEARVIGTCGDREVRYEELRYLTLRFKEDLAAKYGAYIFDDPATGADYEEELLALVRGALCESYATVELCESRGIKTTDKETRQEVKEYVDEAVDYCGGKEGYLSYLAENGMTDWVFRLNAGILSCQYRYYELITTELEKEAYDAVMAGEGFIRTVSIFVRNDEGENLSENRKMAEEVVDAVRRGAAVEDYIGTRYNQDTSSCDYTFMRGYFIEEYEDAAFALEVGEVSDVVEVEDGFYVIQRMEPDEGYFAENLDTLMAMYLSCRMNEDVRALAETLTFTLNESITLWSMQ